MKVLIAFDYNPRHSNPFVRTLADAIRTTGVQLDCSLSGFWKDWQQYDIIHIQWPTSLLYPNYNIDQLKQHLQLLKSNNKKIVVTCHNFVPHYSTNSDEIESYQMVYTMADCIVHMGSYSKDIMQKKYPNTHHAIIPHHIYDSLYKELPTKEEALRKLHLNTKYNYILCFGKFRADEERELVNKVATYCANLGYKILAPGFFTYPVTKRFWLTVSGYIKAIIYRKKYSGIIFTNGYIKDEMLPFYYAAADLALIQRKHILNSGNLPMALMMGKVVVGAALGNVGTELTKLSNPTFDIDNPKSLIEAVKNGIELQSQGLGETNRKYALENMSSYVVGMKYKELYEYLK